MHAEETGREAEVRARLFEAYLFAGSDIGRVDVLVNVALGAGLDRTGAKAVLDVDRHEAAVADARVRALDAGVRTTPTLVVDDRTLEGFHNGAAIRTFLGT